ncbi:hypothetical protein B0J14DRAFT_571150 [Halenospora varia]|nr:hypothetical protein B0J14DRAFT_571150 [Halenospora varia]
MPARSNRTEIEYLFHYVCWNEHHSEEEPEKVVSANPKGQGQRTTDVATTASTEPPPNDSAVNDQQIVPAQKEPVTGNKGGRTGAIRESSTKDLPVPQEARDNSSKVKVELHLEVEEHLYVKVKEDVTIELME